MADFDMDKGVASVVDGLIPEAEQQEEVQPEVQVEPAVQTRPVPKSWAKDYHDHWAKIDPKAQEYIEVREKQMLDGIDGYKTDATFARSLKEVITPYQPMIQAHGLDEAKAVQYLLNAHYRLTQGSTDQRRAAFEELGRNLGFIQQQAQQVDPTVKLLQDQVAQITGTLTAAQQRQYQEVHSRISNEVSTFASAKDGNGNQVHPYFDEVADDIVAFINKGDDLKTAYDKAVYANPVTRAKETARLQKEAQDQLRNKGRKEAQEATKAASTNVRSRDTSRAPTGLMGTMEDTLKETLAKSRTH